MRLARLLFPMLFIFPVASFGQAGVRYDSNLTTSAKNVPVGAQANVMTLPFAKVTICGYPATGSPCTNTVTVYSDQAMTLPITQPIVSDAQGRYGFWIPAALYSYSVATAGGTNVGTFPLSLNSPPGPQGPGGVGCGTGNCIVQNPTGNQSISNPAGTSTNINVLNNTVYANNYATIQLAVAAACNGSQQGSLILPVGIITVSAPLIIPGNCTISGQGGSQSILQASTALTVAVLVTESSNVKLLNFGVDGNRNLNPNKFDCIDLSVGTNIELSGVTASNCLGNGILITTLGNHINIHDGEVYNNGDPNPSVEGASGIEIAAPASFVTINNESIHDNNAGVSVENSSTVSQQVNGVSVTGSTIFSNSNDAILVSTVAVTGSSISGIKVENNEIYCNGWPANGVGFSANCTPGIFQTGANPSQGGVGVDLIQQGTARVIRPIVIGNHIHDDVFEGVSPTTNINPLATSTGTTITWISGPQFDTGMTPGSGILLNGLPYVVASVTSATSMTTKTTVPTLTVPVEMNLPGYMGAIIMGNDVSLSGNANEGPCYYNQFSDGNIYAGNIATSCNLSGFESFYSNSLSYSGDKAYSNDRSGQAQHAAGFLDFGGFGTSYVGISTDDVHTSPTQTSGVFVTATAGNTFIQSSSLKAMTPVNDLSATATFNLNGAIATQNPITSAVAIGSCGLSESLNDVTTGSSTHSVCLQPYLISSGEVGYKFITQDSSGGMQNPLTIDNIGGTIIQYNKPVLATTPTGSCSTVANGTLALSLDGHAASCVAGTWTNRW